jgi:hypothetical protein
MFCSAQYLLVATLAVGTAAAGEPLSTRQAAPRAFWVATAFLPQGTNDIRQTEVTSPQQAAPVANTETPAITVVAPASAGAPSIPGVPAPTGSPAAAPGAPGASSIPEGSPPPLAPGCSVALATPEASVGHTGGTVVFRARFTPPDCAVDPLATVPWIRKAPGTPGLTYTVDANPTRLPRTGSLRAGDAQLVVKQEPGRFASFAAAPGRLEISLEGKKTVRHVITTWSDDPEVVYTASSAAAWVKVTPQTRKAGLQRFEIEIGGGELQPGRHETTVEINSPGSSGRPVRIPVVVTVQPRAK